MRVGVIAIQGDFEKHIHALKACNVPGLEVVQVRTPEDLKSVERAIIPGGESTTVGLLMQRYGMANALHEAAATGMPIWGTCMGMILMAKSIVGREQFSLGLLNIEVTRNAFGAQVHSFEDEVEVVGLDHAVLGVFIRAPIVTKVESPAEVLAQYDGRIVGVRQGKLLGTSFHPELTDDTRLHQFFLKL
jgi:5'-phosphate synthase pdxT subunit